jgi:hypothetical protein
MHEVANSLMPSKERAALASICSWKIKLSCTVILQESVSARSSKYFLQSGCA